MFADPDDAGMMAGASSSPIELVFPFLSFPFLSFRFGLDPTSRDLASSVSRMSFAETWNGSAAEGPMLQSLRRI